MKRIVFLLMLALCVPTIKAQKDLDSALVVNEIVAEDSDTTQANGSSQSKSTTWTFNNGSATTTVTVDSDDDFEEMDDMMEEMFGKYTETFGKWAEKIEKYSWVPIALGILFFFVLPLLIIFLIFYFTYKGRKAKYNTYQKIAETGQPIPEETVKQMYEGDIKMRNEGITNICAGAGLAILLGLIIDEVGIAIGALIACIGIGKLIIWYLSRNDRQKEK